jgi:hypothetical protein
MSADPGGIGAASGGEWVLFVAGGAITLVLLVGTIVGGVLIHREHRRTREREAEETSSEERW